MKILKNAMLAVAILLTGTITVQAQSKQAKEEAKKAELKKMVDNKAFTFQAQSALPMGGGNINLTSEYDLVVKADTIVAFLPYFGRAFTAPMNPTEGGIKFTSTKFSFNPVLKKNGNYEIVVKPSDAKDVRTLVLSLSSSGYGSLIVTSLNKQPITFYGRINENKQPKK